MRSSGVLDRVPGDGWHRTEAVIALGSAELSTKSSCVPEPSTP